MSQRHTDALAHLIYGISESGGFIQLTGEVGTGKTTLIRSLLEQLPEKAEIALILTPHLSRREFLQSICEELGTSPPREDSTKALIDSLNAYLLQAHAVGKRVVLIVDEAQNLSTELLEQVRLLTNLETAKHKLLQIILIGQPELRDVLAQPDMRQITQRITGRYHLHPLSRQDTAAYVKHRIKVAGSQMPIFTAAGIREIYRWSRGVPRLINVVADRALLAAYTQETQTINRRLVRRAAIEVFGRRRIAPLWQWAGAGAAAGALAVAAANLWHHEEQTADAMQTMAIETAAVPADDPPVTSAGDTAEAATEGLAGGAALFTLRELLTDQRIATDIDAAWRDLFALWGAEYDPSLGDPCTQASSYNLRCLSQRGSLSFLRRTNRPAILSLIDEHGRRHEALLGKLGPDSAELVSGGLAFAIGAEELERYWYGEALLLWRPVTPQANDLVPGVRDEGVRWLRETLARLQDEPPSNPESLLYDSLLEARVRRYQRENRLTVDGIVGAQTQIALSTDLEVPGTPLLLGVH